MPAVADRLVQVTHALREKLLAFEAFIAIGLQNLYLLIRRVAGKYFFRFQPELL